MRFKLVACVAVLFAAVGSFFYMSAADGGAVPMSPLEQAAVFGSATHNPGECIKETELGGDCYDESTFCYNGDDYCREQELPVPCSEEIVFHNPTRCKAKAYGSQQCREQENQTIDCYSITQCRYVVEEGDWTCNTDGSPVPFPAKKCQIGPF
jgi:hypothetical protein